MLEITIPFITTIISLIFINDKKVKKWRNKLFCKYKKYKNIINKRQ